jgi:hypothetical protein
MTRMSDEPIPTISTSRKPTLGDRIRGIAHQLRQESDVQIKATSRILGAAAQIAQNHDRLIDEVVEMVEQDLGQPIQVKPAELSSAPYSVERLKQQFKTLKNAKAHFDLKAASWAELATKLNEPATKPHVQAAPPQDAVAQRLEAIEHDIQTIKGDVHQILSLLNAIAERAIAERAIAERAIAERAIVERLP